MPPKGKVGTKGQKQILAENAETLNYYRNIMVGASLLYIVIRLLWKLDTFTWWNWLVLAFATAVYFGCYYFMRMMAQAKYSETGALLDGGLDLNMQSGMGEHIKDIILVTAIVQVLGIFSEYFWLIWFVIPGRAFYLLWVNILSPWIFAPAPEVDEKKQKKMERRQNRRF
ncbi:transmembrane protein 208-like [Lytechinus pictus]|uniref:transmembrane protein 208-like n=1 Tax=Lytechinus pictus TaxID=7653 RepID=UPI00240E5FA0|nr:transmembrane protein 208-like [Lytechinus pictus]